MPTAKHILDAKGGEVVTIHPEATVLDAARLMNVHHIGALVVVRNGELAGIFTERDVLRRVVAEQRDPAETAVDAVMTSTVAVASLDTSTDEIRSVFREQRIRHLPVIEDDRVIGMISIGDLNRTENEVQARTILYLEQYMSVG